MHETPDHIRARLFASLLSLSDFIRECLTLPADPSDPTRHLPESKSADCALKLPNAHCAFRGCAWTGVSADALVTHLQEQHILYLQDSMSALQETLGKAAADDRSLLESMYQESIAIATRKGAPLASYSIYRRCMINYVRDLVEDNTCSLRCLLCARRFPHVARKKHTSIERVRLLERVGEGEQSCAQFCGLTFVQTQTTLGLKAYVQKYGQMSDDVAL